MYQVGAVYKDERDGTAWEILDKEIEIGDTVIFRPTFNRHVVTGIKDHGYGDVVYGVAENGDSHMGGRNWLLPVRERKDV